MTLSSDFCSLTLTTATASAGLKNKKAQEITASKLDRRAKFPAQLGGAAPPPAPIAPIDLPGEHDAQHDAQATGVPERLHAFVISLALTPPMHPGAMFSALIVPLQARYALACPRRPPSASGSRCTCPWRPSASR